MNICGKCKYNKVAERELKGGCIVPACACDNPESECYGCYTQYDDYCDEFEDVER